MEEQGIDTSQTQAAPAAQAAPAKSQKAPIPARVWVVTGICVTLLGWVVAGVMTYQLQTYTNAGFFTRVLRVFGF
jgi:hypothetical protein